MNVTFVVLRYSRKLLQTDGDEIQTRISSSNPPKKKNLNRLICSFWNLLLTTLMNF